MAAFFGKEHRNVLQSIDRLECSAGFTALNFQLSSYKDASGRSLRAVDMTKDGFSFLVMGFTGKEAARLQGALHRRVQRAGS
ncbi:Rha family transcriptional regulator [Pelagibacterium nitratireducens]|uniref:Rha family transcriptional regulator n=1 Tax=Pelagibacterium nitratireducens TaxID=1046114 RepID=UPI003BB09E86